MSTHVNPTPGLPVQKNSPDQLTEHHVPPRWTKRSRTVLIKTRRLHEAYHTLFGAPATRQEAINKLVADWWTDDNGNLI